jgi:peptide subunit release factor 1 (eRF1)
LAATLYAFFVESDVHGASKIALNRGLGIILAMANAVRTRDLKSVSRDCLKECRDSQGIAPTPMPGRHAPPRLLRPSGNTRGIDMSALGFKDLASLLGQFRGEGALLSCYTDLAGADGFRRRWHPRLEALADTIRKSFGDNEASRLEFDRNLTAVRNAIKSADPSDGRWLAVFCAQQRGFYQTFPLDTPVASQVATDPSPYLVPLLRAIHRRREYLAVHADVHRGQLYSATPGKIQLIDDLGADVPAKQHSSGETWGQNQSFIVRHREDAIMHFRKDLVHNIEHAWANHRFAGLILLGAHPGLEHLRKELPPRLRTRVERETPASWYEQPAEFAAALQEIVCQTLLEDEAKAVTGIWDRLAANRAVATGATAVLAAVQSGKIESHGHGYLLLGPDPRETVGRCTQCHSLAANTPAACPRCQSPCAVASLWEELLLMALRHGIQAYFVDDANKLAPYGGVVAALAKSPIY